MRRAIRLGRLSEAGSAILATAERAQAEYRDRRDEILEAMETAEREQRYPNPAAGLVALADDDLNTRTRAQHLIARADERTQQRKDQNRGR